MYWRPLAFACPLRQLCWRIPSGNRREVAHGSVPAGRVKVRGADGPVEVDVPAFWLGQTEVTWEMYDVFLLRLDLPREERSQVAASARPSRPYGAPDAGFGHRGYPVISVTHGAATKFALWLSVRTGHRYLVASDEQWSLAARLAGADTIRSELIAWTSANADATTHPVARWRRTHSDRTICWECREWVNWSRWFGVFAPRQPSWIRGQCHHGNNGRTNCPSGPSDPQIPRSLVAL